MIDIQNLSIQYSGKYLFEDVNLRINENDRIALVGPNGSGKTTLLRLLTDIEHPEDGSINKKKNLSVGFLPQEFISNSNRNLFDEVKSSLKSYTELEDHELRINEKLQLLDDNDPEKLKLLDTIGKIHHKKEHIEFYSIDAKIAKVLEGLGFKEEEFSNSMKQFSGGWQMRIELAKILLNDHDLILLDEPTNHLDIPSLEWLINYLKQSNNALLIVSHDRRFLNLVTDKTFEIFNKGINYFKGNYESFIKYKEERDLQLRAQLKNQLKRRKEIERFIERFRYKNTKAKQVQSRIKLLDKEEIIEIDEDDSSIDFKFPEPGRSGVIPVELNNLSKSYGSKSVLENIQLRIERGDKVAFVGRNGEGKTTLAKIIAKRLEPTSGKINYGQNVEIAYYSQEVTEELNLENDVYDSVAQVAEDLTPVQIRSLLGSFLFTSDDVFKKVKILSGGEKSRVALAKILFTKSNLLILDEPTNHLDFNSKQILQRALINFSGTIIMISHDIDFIAPIANKTIEFKNKKIHEYPGDINYYLSKISEEQEPDSNEESDSQQKLKRKNLKRQEAELRNKKFNATKKLKERITELESEIERLESEKLNLETELGSPDVFSNPNLAKEKNKNYDEIKSMLNSTYDEWTNISHELEEIEKSFDQSIS
ncbi:MAG: ABC-F family ATP-binding cassette domain-containing protein [Melioribacteraceae bacterium]|nr:ABC-F family ATP-binding cassette domain-containing protein [Melioribacteraceae bacterium]MCF8356173.1 ABC-F family ATP-binding cassette domain-containing protein [Melioribacteraceae bacterium]MCF8394744.1 ABC-F family ATP-binding cassette domain-containing protein [Melioribacteraceae bacterium]MCF8417956.1 ABC-F family ATP-binding cassette domain-containing protein [Melioribacteraceae bacterium]